MTLKPLLLVPITGALLLGSPVFAKRDVCGPDLSDMNDLRNLPSLTNESCPMRSNSLSEAVAWLVSVSDAYPYWDTCYATCHYSNGDTFVCRWYPHKWKQSLTCFSPPRY